MSSLKKVVLIQAFLKANKHIRETEILKIQAITVIIIDSFEEMKAGESM